MDAVDLGAQPVQQGAGDGVARARAVELEDADVAAARRGEVGHADEGLLGGGGGGGVAAPEAEGYGEEGGGGGGAGSKGGEEGAAAAGLVLPREAGEAGEGRHGRVGSGDARVGGGGLGVTSFSLPLSL